MSTAAHPARPVAHAPARRRIVVRDARRRRVATFRAARPVRAADLRGAVEAVRAARDVLDYSGGPYA